MSRYYYELSNAARTLQNGEEMIASGMAGLDETLGEVIKQMTADKSVPGPVVGRVVAVRHALQDAAKEIAGLLAPHERELRQLAAKFPDTEE